MHSLPQIDIGKSPAEPLHVNHFLPLPADTPYGNLSLKYTKIIERLDRVNVKIQTTYQSFGRLHAHDISVEISDDTIQDISHNISEHLFLLEEIVYWLRKTVDELIGLTYVLTARAETGRYPDRVAPDSIGGLLHLKEKAPALYTKHISFMHLLNDVANAYKHSFMNSDIGLIGRDEPLLHALGLRHNNLKNEPVLYALSLRELIVAFDAFFTDVVSELRKCPVPHRAPQAEQPI